MGKFGIITVIKQWIAGIGFKLFIWGNDTTQEEYWEDIYQQEKAYKNRVDIGYDEY